MVSCPRHSQFGGIWALAIERGCRNHEEGRLATKASPKCGNDDVGLPTAPLHPDPSAPVVLTGDISNFLHHRFCSSGIPCFFVLRKSYWPTPSSSCEPCESRALQVLPVTPR
ncbi:hypothetical protein N7468_005988 [Penicillium chermesinum]|uniref:Uncharacterized protein n=1 Tax=Penicillium chermesinum TaxID=63820 RepID=A0A9W9TNR8_9EURO|nr:uncharacterized protein N7468_005988 [Penicillium chermesinum]KAJ5233032.1 hypothetical protein N7468_005988 [Penicillium chermesinum]